MKNLHLGVISSIALAAILVGCATPQYTYKPANKPAKSLSDKYASPSAKSSDESTAMVATPVTPKLASTECFSITKDGTEAAALFVALPFLYAKTWRKGTTDKRTHGGLGCGFSFLGVSMAIPLFVAGVAALVPGAGCSVYELMTGKRYIPKLQKTPPPILVKSSDSDCGKSLSVMGTVETVTTVPIIVVTLPTWVVGFTWACSFAMIDSALSSVLTGEGDGTTGCAHAAPPPTTPNTSATLERHALSPKHRP